MKYKLINPLDAHELYWLGISWYHVKKHRLKYKIYGYTYMLTHNLTEKQFQLLSEFDNVAIMDKRIIILTKAQFKRDLVSWHHNLKHF